MDRNTLIGLLLMGVVIFGFTWLSKPSEEELAQQRKQATEQQQQQQQDVTVGNVDTLSVNEMAQLEDMLKADSCINEDGVMLALKDGVITGTVNNMPWEEVRADSSSNPANHNRAVQAVQRVLNTNLQYGPFAKALSGTEQIVKLQNDSLAIELSTKGGIISKATLKGYKAWNAPQVVLFDKGDNNYSFTLANNTQRFETKNLYFIPNQINDSTVLMNLPLDGGAEWGLKYTLVPGSYMVRMEMVQKNMASIIPANITQVDLDWHQRISRHEEGKMFEERNSGVYYKFAGKDGDVKHLSENGDDSEEVKDQVKWLSAKNQFFSTVLISNTSMSTANMTSHAFKSDNNNQQYEKYVKDVNMHTIIPYSSSKQSPASFYFYMGPNRYHLLSEYDKYSPGEDLRLTHLIPLGWKLFRWINTGVIIPIFDWLGRFMSNYGLIILVLTIIIKLVLSPLTYKSYISQAKMRILAPDIAAINEKYPNREDAIKKQQKTMELYKQAGASPFGGCLPMLLQMPILIAMFTFFPSCIELRGQSFLWANDLSAPDKIVEWSQNIPFISGTFGNHISLFCMLMTVTNILYTYISMKSQSSSSMPGMKWIMYLMPLMFLVFFNNYAAGLSYYYFISLLITILQTYSCRLFITEDKVRATIAANAAKPKKKSKWMQRLEEAQKQQAAMQRQQQNKGGKRKR